MGYKVNLTNGNILTSVPDSQMVSDYGGLTLIGKKYPGFGTVLNEDLVRITENFANSTPPPNPFIGQFWFDSVSNIIKFWNGTIFKPISVITTGAVAPLNPLEGDEWFDTVHKQLFVWDITLNQWILIGPPGSEGTGLEGFVVTALASNSNIIYLELYANDNLIAIVSSDNLISPGIAGFGNIRPGINFVTSPTHGITGSGIYNVNDISIGDNDQLRMSIDVNDNTVLSVNNGNVLYATNGNTLVAGELANITGTVYINNLVVANSLYSTVPGSNNQVLFNQNGILSATANLTLDSTGENVIIPNTLNVENIEVYDTVDIAGNVNSTGANIIGPLTVANSAAISESLLISENLSVLGTAILGGLITGAETASYVTIQPGATAPKALVVQTFGGSTNLLTIDSVGDTTVNGTLTVQNQLSVDGVSTLDALVTAQSDLHIQGTTVINQGGAGQISLPTAAPPSVGSPLINAGSALAAWGNYNLNSFLTHALSGNGYQNFPGGLILQWGTTPSLENNTTQNFPFTIPFTHACFGMVATDNGPRVTLGVPQSMAAAPTDSGHFNIICGGSGETAFWIAIGY